MSVRLISKPTIIATFLLVAATGMGTYVWKQEHRPPLLEIYVFGLKNNQATFIRTPDDKRILINGGANSEIIRHVSKILPFYSRHIDTIIATTPQEKSTGGLIDLIERDPPDRAIIPSLIPESLGLASSSDPTYRQFLKTARVKEVPLREIIAGETIELGDGPQGKILAHMLFPALPELFEYSNASPPEIILEITYDDTHVLLIGDASKKIQKFLIPEITTPLDALVTSQSPSATNLATELLKATTPEYLIYSQRISASTGSITPIFKDILYEKRFNTQEKGVVRIVSDGEVVSVERLAK